MVDSTGLSTVSEAPDSRRLETLVVEHAGYIAREEAGGPAEHSDLSAHYRDFSAEAAQMSVIGPAYRPSPETCDILRRGASDMRGYHRIDYRGNALLSGERIAAETEDFADARRQYLQAIRGAQTPQDWLRVAECGRVLALNGQDISFSKPIASRLVQALGGVIAEADEQYGPREFQNAAAMAANMLIMHAGCPMFDGQQLRTIRSTASMPSFDEAREQSMHDGKLDKELRLESARVILSANELRIPEGGGLVIDNRRLAPADGGDGRAAQQVIDTVRTDLKDRI